VSRPKATEIKGRLGLEPHPTCGFVRESFRSEAIIPRAALPGFGGDRRAGSVLYFLVTPGARMALHRIRPEQMYHHYLGDPLEVLLLDPDGGGEVAEVGSLDDGLRPQLHIPGNAWHVSRLRAGGEYALLATTEWPAVEPEDVEAPDVDTLIASHAEMAEKIREFAHTEPAAPLRA
jgi:predicted cupin superfamily sugar epimerase